jgi:hypothetical protein
MNIEMIASFVGRLSRICHLQLKLWSCLGVAEYSNDLTPLTKFFGEIGIASLRRYQPEAGPQCVPSPEAGNERLGYFFSL